MAEEKMEIEKPEQEGDESESELTDVSSYYSSEEGERGRELDETQEQLCDEGVTTQDFFHLVTGECLSLRGF